MQLIKPDAKIYNVLPIERFLKKFLASKINLDPEYILSTKDVFGSYIFALLQNQYYKVELSEYKLNDFIKITIPNSYKNEGRVCFIPSGVHLANSFVRNLFNEEFLTYMNVSSQYGLRTDLLIESFCNQHQIDLDIDINYETLKKFYYRWRLKNGQIVQKYAIIQKFN